MEELAELRKEIDQIDEELLNLIARRLTVVKKIGDIKRKLQKPIVDTKREKEKIEVLANKGKKYKLTKETISTIWQTLFEVAYNIEK